MQTPDCKEEVEITIPYYITALRALGFKETDSLFESFVLKIGYEPDEVLNDQQTCFNDQYNYWEINSLVKYLKEYHQNHTSAVFELKATNLKTQGGKESEDLAHTAELNVGLNFTPDGDFIRGLAKTLQFTKEAEGPAIPTFISTHLPVPDSID